MKKSIIYTCLIIFGLNSCTYPDGPAFSLTSKTKRLVGKWKAVELQQNEIKITLDDTRFETVEFLENGDCIYNSVTDSGTFNLNGSWTFISDNTEIRVTDNSGQEFFKYAVTRLTKEELWAFYNNTLVQRRRVKYEKQ
jgi:hypothetical protein